VKVRYKALSIIAVLTFLLALVPAIPAGAAAGKVTLDKAAYTSLGGSNVAVVQVEDSDLNVSKSLPNSWEIVTSTGSDKKTYTVANTPIREAGLQIKALQSGTRFLSVTSLTAATGTVVMSAVTTEGDAHQSLLASSAVAGAEDTFAGPINTAFDLTLGTGAAGKDAAGKVKFTVTDVGADGGTGTTSISLAVTGRLVNVALEDIDAAAAKETTAADDVKTYAISNIAEEGTGNVTTADLWKSISKVTVTLTSTAGGVKIKMDELTSVAVSYVYDSADNTGTGTKTTVTATSGSNTTGINLALTETTATSAKFTQQIALIDATKLASINNLIITTNLARTTDTIASLQTKLTAAATAASETATGANTVANKWVTDTVTAMSGVTTASTISVLLGTGVAGTGLTIEVAHGDTVTTTYTDTATVSTDTAKIDATAPAIASLGPADKAATNDATPLLTAEVTDADQGVLLAAITVSLNGVDKTSAAGFDSDPLTDGFRVKFTSATLAEGSHTWILVATDKVGNKVTKTQTFTIDTTKPTISAVETGTGIKAAATDLDTKLGIDESVEYAAATAIKVTFSEVLDTASVTAADFTVDGVAPTSVSQSAKLYDASATPVAIADDGKYVYLVVDAMAADKKPKVNISATGAVTDKAGNGMTKLTTAKTATDKIKPGVTVALSSTLGKNKDKVTVTVTVDEALSDLDVAVNNKATSALISALAMNETATNVWTASYTIAASVEYEVVAVAKDKTPNATTKKIAFQGDITVPTIGIGAVGEAGGKVEEGVVWLEYSFSDATEYTGDTHKKITVASATLETLSKAGGTVTATEDVAASLFSSDNAKYTLAKSLAKGFYKAKIKGTDEAGNSTAVTSHAFEVTAKAKTNIAISPGWNLISLPGAPADGAINTIFGLTDPVDTVMSLDAATGTYTTAIRSATGEVFAGDLSVLAAGNAYWVNANAAFTLKVTIPGQAGGTNPPEIDVEEGYNAIGVYTIAGESVVDADKYLSSVAWTVAYSYDPDPTKGWSVIRPKGSDVVSSTKGYLVYISAKDTLTP